VKFRSEYPRVIARDRGTTWLPSNIEANLVQRDEWLSGTWMESQYMEESIPQVPHTHGSLEGQYGIINDMQVGIAESTCGAKLWAGPKGAECSRCKALLDVSELSRIALERASSAREAIQIMGDLAVEFGFYGSSWDEEDPSLNLEAGESLIVSDTNELWVFHIGSDDTAESAVWVAQRVPPGHVTAVTNQWIIRQVHRDYDDDWFMASQNLWEVALRAGFWKGEEEEGPLDFAASFAARPGDIPHYTYSTRRLWRIMDVVAPSQQLSPYTDSLGGSLPFSVAPDRPLTVKDVMDLLRDHYEGTDFDMTRGLLSGAFGDYDRYDIRPQGQGEVTAEESKSGFFERAIGLFRTSHSYITQSRRGLPHPLGGIAWIAQYSPSVSAFVPLHVGIEEVPVPYSTGSLFAFSPSCSWWIACAAGNYAGRSRTYTQPVISSLQNELELAFIDAEEQVEEGSDLTMLAEQAVSDALFAYQGLFEQLISGFHDGYYLQDTSSTSVQLQKQYYSREWLIAAGYLERRFIDAAALEITKHAGEVYNDATRAKIALLSEVSRLTAEARRGVQRVRDARDLLQGLLQESEQAGSSKGLEFDQDQDAVLLLLQRTQDDILRTLLQEKVEDRAEDSPPHEGGSHFSLVFYILTIMAAAVVAVGASGAILVQRRGATGYQSVPSDMGKR
jgi:dipeptidase